MPDGANTSCHIDSKILRNMMVIHPVPQPIQQLQRWGEILSSNFENDTLIDLNWRKVFENLYKASNNFKLLQHQYKIFMQIATNKYHRYKMKITTSYNCYFCGPETVETLEHIYLKCPKTVNFKQKLNVFIRNFIDRDYPENEIVSQFTIDHQNEAINFLYLVLHWYIGRKAQYDKALYWDEYVKFSGQFLLGEKVAIRLVLQNILQ